MAEHGIADLRRLSPIEHADKLIMKCAHPDYRERLRAYLDHTSEGPGYISHELTAAYSSLD